jgi:excisionase family DNA binding protein
MADSQFLSTSQLAHLMGISRIAVFKKIQKGQIKATKVGRNYVINSRDVGNIIGTTLTVQDKRDVDEAVTSTVQEYGEALKLLGRE